ncbi:phenylalanine--tRNA ligase alpha subunit [Mycoplasma sp. CAG:956]|nr:phenylalanine--tRNA ligase alpha subunit [Mycoplasma sp. CAG:956]
MQEKIKNIKETILNNLQNIKDINSLTELKNKYLSKKGEISGLLANLGSMDIEERKTYGSLVNTLKQEVTKLISDKETTIKEEILNKKLESEDIDISLPATKIPVGSPCILEKLILDVEEIFMSMGYDVVDGPEIELDKYNFEMLNLPKGHPAREAQDTFYVKGEELLLRSQTSPVQIRTMLKGEGKKPIRVICPGKTYRRDDDDATHSHQFTQIEGLLVDKNISLSDLKGTIDLAAKKLYGIDTKTRFHPSYYPFTEPSVEVDITCCNCHGTGCNVCKQTGWVTVCGAGIVHPNVLKMAGYDPNEWSGFAFGFGAERLAMIKYDINDIRVFYNNDLREIKTFDRKEKEND